MFGAAKWAGAVLSALVGVTFLGLTLAAMNREAKAPKEVAGTEVEVFKPEPKKKPPKTKKVRKPQPKPRPRRSRAPAPKLPADLGGLGTGVPLFDASDLGDLQDGLLSADTDKDLVMTAESVDQQPQLDPDSCRIPTPKRAQAQGLKGRLLLRLTIGKDGRVRKASVVDASIPDWWVEQVVPYVQNQCSFQPATYQGQPVQMNVELPISFT